MHPRGYFLDGEFKIIDVAGDAYVSNLFAIAAVHVGGTNLLEAINSKAATVHTHTKSQITDFTHSHDNATLDSIDWNKILNRPAGLDDGDNVGEAGSGEANTASSLGNGWRLFYDKSGVDLRFNTVTNSAGLTIISNANMFVFGIDTSVIATDAEVAAGYAPLGHTHSIADVTGLQAALDLKAVDADVLHKAVSGEINAMTSKGAPTTSDLLVIEDTAASNAKKKVTAGALPISTATQSALDVKAVDADVFHKATAGEVNSLTSKGTPVANDLLMIEDSAASNAKKKATAGSLPISTATQAALDAKQASDPDLTALAGIAGVQGDLIAHNGTTWVRVPKGAANQYFKMNSGATAQEWATLSAGSGDVVGPSSSTDFDIAVFDNTTGKLLKVVTGFKTDASGNLYLPGGISSGVGGTTPMVFQLPFGGRMTNAGNDVRYTNDIPYLLRSNVTMTADVFLGSTNAAGAIAANASAIALKATDADVFHKATAGEFNALTVKGTPVGADILPLEDSAASNAKKKVTLATLPISTLTQAALDLKATDSTVIHNNVGGEIVALADKAAPVGADHILIEDSAASNAKKDVLLSTLPISTPAQTALDLKATDADVFHKATAGEFNALTSKGTPVAGDIIAIEDSAASNAKKKTTAGALPISTPTQTALDTKAPLARYRTVWVDAGAMVSRTTAGAASGTEELASNDIMSDYFAFDDTTAEAVQFWIAMPDEWDRGTVKVKVYWYSASATTSHTAVWGVKARAVSNDDALDGTWGSEVEVSDDVIAAGDLHVTAATGAITVGGTPALGDLIGFEVDQDATEADHVGDVKLRGIMLQFQETTAPAIW